ncbi:MAG TPA: MBL fold metallo-hydrolase [Caulobacteraceae bacterium]|jgi:L-ascorbate metabolism protein UlaG (beta-lactamase superfamily)|nr:MBL fold metallo-hydrolase [Caulobacteraceae bacterium]
MLDRSLRPAALLCFLAAVLHAPVLSAAPAPQAKSPPNRVTDVVATSQGELRVTPLFHGSVLLEFGGKETYVDPWGAADYTGLPMADLIVITHTHADHLDRAMVEQLKKAGTVIVGPDAVIDTLNCAPMCGQLVPVNNGEKKTVAGVPLQGVAMYNLKNGPPGGTVYHHKGVGGGYVLNFGDAAVYVSGDTECTPEMKALRNITVAFLAMNPPRTMSPLEAAECAKAFRPKIVYPYHYKGADPADFAGAMKATPGVEVRLRKLEGEP